METSLALIAEKIKKCFHCLKAFFYCNEKQELPSLINPEPLAPNID